MTLYLALGAVALILLLGLAVYLLARSLKAARQEARIAQGKAEEAEAARAATMTELEARERDRHDLQDKLAALQTGTPAARLDASLDGLRNLAAHTAAASSAGGMARSPAPARDGN